MFLEQLGADARLAELLQPHAADGCELGRISFAAHEQYRVYLESGDCEAAPAGRLRWSDTLPAVGDWVATRRVDRELALIEAVLPRRTCFSRHAAGSATEEQVIAANIDVAVVVCGLDGNFNLRRLERYLVLAHESGAEPVIALNKVDLCGAVSERLEAVREVSPGERIVAISATESVAPLASLVRGRTVVFLGSSGVGKSTIVNALLGGASQPTTPVRECDSKGRHTTTSRMLIPIPGGGAVIDTPGMRELQLWASEESLEDVFAEVAAFAAGCRFGDCTHGAEPECAVRAALETGALTVSRWESYRKLQAEVRHQHVQSDARAQAEQKRRWKAIHKAFRHHPKYQR